MRYLFDEHVLDTDRRELHRADDYAIFEKGLCEAGLPKRHGAATPLTGWTDVRGLLFRYRRPIVEG